MVSKNKLSKQERLNAMHKQEKMKKNSIIGIIGILIIAGIIFSFSGILNNNEKKNTIEKQITSLSIADKTITLYKDPNCGCCEGYAKELRRNGFDVTIIKEPDMQSIKKKYGISSMIESCHTSVFKNGYIVEGHTPIEAVMKMLNEKPQISGIGMGGMPAGSAGMPGQKRGEFKVYTIEDNINNLYMTV